MVREEEGSAEGEEGLVWIGTLSAVMEIIYTSQCEDIWATKGYNVHVLGYNCLFVCSNVSYMYVHLHTKFFKFVQRRVHAHCLFFINQHDKKINM